MSLVHYYPCDALGGWSAALAETVDPDYDEEQSRSVDFDEWDGEIERRFDPERVPAGFTGSGPRGPRHGGQFAPKFLALVRLLKDWMSDKGPDDPFHEYTTDEDREPLRRFARDAGIPLRRGAKINEIKNTIYTHVREHGVPEAPAAAKAVKKAAPKAAAPRAPRKPMSNLTRVFRRSDMADERHRRKVKDALDTATTEELHDFADTQGIAGHEGLNRRELVDHVSFDLFGNHVPEPLPTKAAKAAPAKKAAPSVPKRGRVQGRDLLASRDTTATARRVLDDARRYRSLDDPRDSRPEVADPRLSAIAASQGFDGLPEVVSTEEMDRLYGSGSVRLARGVSAGQSRTKAQAKLSPAQIHEQLRSGHAYYGLGYAGNGYTFAAGPAGMADLYGDESPDAVVRATLSPDARVGTLQEIHRDYDRYAREHGWERPSDRVANPELADNPHYQAFGDIGRFAAAKGYDAYWVGPDHEMVVLNRTKLIVERGSPSPDASPVKKTAPKTPRSSALVDDPDVQAAIGGLRESEADFARRVLRGEFFRGGGNTSRPSVASQLRVHAGAMRRNADVAHRAHPGSNTKAVRDREYEAAERLDRVADLIYPRRGAAASPVKTARPAKAVKAAPSKIAPKKLTPAQISDMSPEDAAQAARDGRASRPAAARRIREVAKRLREHAAYSRMTGPATGTARGPNPESLAADAEAAKLERLADEISGGPSVAKKTAPTLTPHIRDVHQRLGFTPRQAEIDAAVRRAYVDLRGRTDLPTSGVGYSVGGAPAQMDAQSAIRAGGEAVFLADIRDALGERYNRHEIDEVIRKLGRGDGDKSFYLAPIHYPWMLGQRDRDSQILMGNQHYDTISIEPSGWPAGSRAAKKTVGGVAKKTAPAKATGSVSVASLKPGDYAEVSGTDQYGQPIHGTGYVGNPTRVSVRTGSKREEAYSVTVTETPNGADGWRMQVIVPLDGSVRKATPRKTATKALGPPVAGASLTGRTEDDLRAIASAEGIAIPPGLNAAEIRKLISAHRRATGGLDMAGWAAHVRGLGSEGAVVRALDAEPDLTAPRLRVLARRLGIDVPDSVKTKAALQSLIARHAFGKGPSSPQPGIIGKPSAFNAGDVAYRLTHLDTEREIADALRPYNKAQLTAIWRALGQGRREFSGQFPSTGRLFPKDVNTAEEIRAYMARIIRQDRNRWSLQ